MCCSRIRQENELCLLIHVVGTRKDEQQLAPAWILWLNNKISQVRVFLTHALFGSLGQSWPAALLSPLQHQEWKWRFCYSVRLSKLGMFCLASRTGSLPWRRAACWKPYHEAKSLKDIIYLLASICSLYCVRQTDCACRREEMPGRKDVPLTAQSPGFLHVQHVHFCVVLNWCCTSSLAWNPWSPLLGGLWVWFCWSRLEGDVSLSARPVVLLHCCSAGAAKAPRCASPNIGLTEPGQPGLPKKLPGFEHFQGGFGVSTEFVPACWPL